MDLNQLGPLLTQMVPFVRTLGIVIDKVEPGAATATLASRPDVCNHLGTLHAGAAYTLGETASGGAVLSVFADKLPGAFVALKAASVAHKKAAPGDTVATARLAAPASEARAAYDATGKADFDVLVDLHVGDVHTAAITYTWAVRAPR